jgi:hypothetical protein
MRNIRRFVPYAVVLVLLATNGIAQEHGVRGVAARLQADRGDAKSRERNKRAFRCGHREVELKTVGVGWGQAW